MLHTQFSAGTGASYTLAEGSQAEKDSRVRAACAGGLTPTVASFIPSSPPQGTALGWTAGEVRISTAHVGEYVRSQYLHGYHPQRAVWRWKPAPSQKHAISNPSLVLDNVLWRVNAEGVLPVRSPPLGGRVPSRFGSRLYPRRRAFHGYDGSLDVLFTAICSQPKRWWGPCPPSSRRGRGAR